MVEDSYNQALNHVWGLLDDKNKMTVTLDDIEHDYTSLELERIANQLGDERFAEEFFCKFT